MAADRKRLPDFRNAQCDGQIWTDKPRTKSGTKRSICSNQFLLRSVQTHCGKPSGNALSIHNKQSFMKTCFEPPPKRAETNLSQEHHSRTPGLHYPNDIDRSLHESTVCTSSIFTNSSGFLQSQEFSFHNITVTSSTIVVYPSHHSSNRKWDIQSET